MGVLLDLPDFSEFFEFSNEKMIQNGKISEMGSVSSARVVYQRFLDDRVTLRSVGLEGLEMGCRRNWCW